MFGLLRGIARAAPALRGSINTQRANITSKPAKNYIGPVDVAVGLTVFSVTLLAPAAWILTHIDYYSNYHLEADSE